MEIKSVVKNDRKNSLVCLLFKNSQLKCYKFHFSKGTFSDTVEFYDEIETDFKCRISSYGMKLNYLSDGQTIALSCINYGRNSTVQAKFFNKSLDVISKSYSQFSQCQNIYGHSIILYNSAYYIISDVVCDNYKRCYEPLESELSPIIITTTQNIEFFEEEEK